MRFPLLILALSACSLQLPGAGAPPPAAPVASNLPLPAIGPECTGPGPGNFNGAHLTQALVNSVPRQFAADRAALQRVLDGRADAATREFARACHGVTFS